MIIVIYHTSTCSQTSSYGLPSDIPKLLRAQLNRGKIYTIYDGKFDLQSSREAAEGTVQRNAMPVWRGEGDFLSLLKQDKDARRYGSLALVMSAIIPSSDVVGRQIIMKSNSSRTLLKVRYETRHALSIDAIVFATQANAQSAYCAKVGNDDNVKPIPEKLVPAARRLFNLSDESIGDIQESTTFRCMSGKVWLCNYGANLPCGGKANVSRISQGV